MKLDTWIVRNIATDLSVAALAKRARMSVRSFARAYQESKGTTPAKAVETLRLTAAARLLAQISETPPSLKQVAHTCGFGSAGAMRRTFRRRWGFTPALWRDAISEAAVTEEEEAQLLETLDTMDKRILCLSVHLDRQVALILDTLTTQLNRIEVLVGGSPPVMPDPPDSVGPPIEPPPEGTDGTPA